MLRKTDTVSNTNFQSFIARQLARHTDIINLLIMQRKLQHLEHPAKHDRLLSQRDSNKHKLHDIVYWRKGIRKLKDSGIYGIGYS